MNTRSFILFEMVVLCLIIPGIIIGMRLAPFMFAFLWGASAYCLFIMRAHHKDRLKILWNWQAITVKNMTPVILRWMVASAGMVLFIMWYDPERLFYIQHHNPDLIPKLMVLYPVLSALPQEFIFCSFFFARYAPLFGQGWKMILMSAVTFAYAHVLYINPVAPTLSLLGGLIFAQSYAKHKSLALVTIEHGLYGNSLFIIGLGWYFYSGAVPTG